MTEDQLQRLKAYVKPDHDEDDELLQALWCAAVEYLANAGVPESDSDLYWLAAAGLVLDWYDSGAVGAPVVGLRAVINQLKLLSVGDGADF